MGPIKRTVAFEPAPVDPSTLSIRDHRRMLRKKQITASDSVVAILEKAKAERELNIYITLTADGAMTQAMQSDERIAKGTPRILEGVPIAVKDNYCTRGIRTTAGSRMLEQFIPPYESSVTQRLIDAGAVILGKTNMDEFAMGSSTESSFFGPTINPVGKTLGLPNLVPGGSSGGSAAAVAAKVAVAAVGTDTGGSIRQPAAFCGVVGMKPSYGLCSRRGIIAYASSLDQAGAFGKCVEDVAILLDVMIGHDERDTTSVSRPEISLTYALAQRSKRLRIGFPVEMMNLQSTDEVRRIWVAALKAARSLDADIVDISLPSLAHALPAYYIIALSEASSNLSRYDGVRYGFRAPGATNTTEMYELTRSMGFGAEVKRRVILGTYSLSAGYYEAYYLRALKIRRLVSNDFAMAFQDVDVIFMPTAPTSAFQIGSHDNDPIKMYLEDVFTVPVNLAGLPAISLPITADNRGMPLGLQIVGPQFGDETVIRAAASVEVAAASSS